jgi:hypothetical protein
VATHNTAQSGQSMTHFRKHDKLQDSYGAFSISSKGGNKHLGQMVSEAGVCGVDARDGLRERADGVSHDDAMAQRLTPQFSLPPDPSTWSYLGPEADDEFHDPDVKPRKQTGFLAALFTMRGAGNIGCLAFLLLVLVGLL